MSSSHWKVKITWTLLLVQVIIICRIKDIVGVEITIKVLAIQHVFIGSWPYSCTNEMLSSTSVSTCLAGVYTVYSDNINLAHTISIFRMFTVAS